MPLGPQDSAEQIRADLEHAHAAVFGARSDEALASLLDSTAQALYTLASRELSAYEAEPDFITGSSEREASA